MKEIEKLTPDQLHVSKEKPVEKKLVLVGCLVPQRGQVCWQYNFKTGKVTEAGYEHEVIGYSDQIAGRKINRRLIINDDCLYELAINRKNAIRKFKKKILSIQSVVANTSRKIN